MAILACLASRPSIGVAWESPLQLVSKGMGYGSRLWKVDRPSPRYNAGRSCVDRLGTEEQGSNWRGAINVLSSWGWRLHPTRWQQLESYGSQRHFGALLAARGPCCPSRAGGHSLNTTRTRAWCGASQSSGYKKRDAA